MSRTDFPKSVKEVIAKRAGYRCSFPGCERLLVGPDDDPDRASIYGECAHIYAATSDGPRGQNHLTDKDLKKTENGIYLCPEHHKEIDSKSKEETYSAQRLSMYKDMHENSISAKVGNMLYPLMWIRSFKIIHSPLLKDNVQFDLTKTTLVNGSNGVGKSLLVEYVYTTLTGKCTSRLSKGESEVKIQLSNPVRSDITCKIRNGKISYIINGQTTMFCPFNIDVFYIQDTNGNTKGDCINRICKVIGRNREFTKLMIEGCNLEKGYIITNAILKTVRTKPYEKMTIKVKKKKDEPDGPEYKFECLSGTEQRSTIIDWVVEYLTQMSKYKNILLLMDWNEFQTFDSDMKNHFLAFIHNASSCFQSIITTHTLWENVKWIGWSLLTMKEEEHIDIKYNELNG